MTSHRGDHFRPSRRHLAGPLAVAATVGLAVDLVTGGTASAAAATGSRLSVVAGTGTAGTPTPGRAAHSKLDQPFGLALDASGDLYIADARNHEVEKVTPAGKLSVFAGTGRAGPTVPGRARHADLLYPDGVAVGRSGVVYIADAGNHLIDRVSAGGMLSIVAGTGTSGPATPGRATRSDLSFPYGLAVGPTGALYIADTFNNQVDKVSPAGMLSIVAGTGAIGAVRPGPARRSPLNHPAGVAVTGRGVLYIADTFESQIVKVSQRGIISVVAGSGASGPATPGPARDSPLKYCYAVATDRGGNVYIADTFNHVVEKVAPSGHLSVVAGTGIPGRPAAGPATKRDLDEPDGVVVSSSGVIYISDYAANEVVKVVRR